MRFIKRVKKCKIDYDFFIFTKTQSNVLKMYKAGSIQKFDFAA